MTATSSRPAVAVTGVRKSYGDVVVLDAINLSVAEGTVFALLGPNGAGKTTMVQILSTLVTADAGRLQVAGHNIATAADAVREAIGVTGQFSAVDNLLTGQENLVLMADLHHLPRAAGRRRIADLVRRFDLGDAIGKPASTYSGGMRRRLDLAMSMIGSPRIVFLDEPTTGLDPRGRHAMWQIVRDLVAAGVTIFLTTQYLDEADQLADRIALLDHGKVVAEGSPAELKRLIPGGHIELRFADALQFEAASSVLGSVSGTASGNGAIRNDNALTLQVPGDGAVRSLRALLDRLDAESIEIDGLAVHTPDLDDVFFALTGRPDHHSGQRTGQQIQQKEALR
ncbi:MAG: ATP-binding cassette domain-containing protein [Actinomycetota bacterium]|nr:ATP-binding cassette domain-containing protein [Actinomycetota bacterium]